MAHPLLRPRQESSSSSRSTRSEQLRAEHVPSPLEIEIKRVVEANFGRDLQDRFALFARHSAVTNAQVVCVGPTKAGKSTLVNGIFGRVIVPSGVLPETVLPVGFYGSPEVTETYEIRSSGEGLDTFLEMRDPISGKLGRLSGLTAGHAFKELKRLNGASREKLRAVDAKGGASEFRSQYPRFAEWRLDVVAPNVFANFTLVDCPGGSEHGLLGDAIQAFLRHQVSQACLALLVVKASNIVPLTDSTGVASFFGGTSQTKDVVVVVNAVEDERTRQDAEKLLGQALTKSSLGNLRQRKTCYMSGQALLGFNLLKQKFPQLLRQARGPVTVEQFLKELDLSGYAEKLDDEGYEDIATLVGMAKAGELEQVLTDDIGMTPNETTKLVEALAVDAEMLPSMHSEEFQQSKDELQIMFETVFRTADFQSMYDRVRNDLPGHIQKTFLAKHADTASFHTFLIEFIAKERVKLIARHMLDSAMVMAKEELRRLDLEVISAEQTIEEAQADLEKFEHKCQPSEILGFKHFIREELLPLVDGDFFGLPEVKVRLEGAAKLFGTCEQAKLTAEDVRRMCGEDVAISWLNNVNKARQSDADGVARGISVFSVARVLADGGSTGGEKSQELRAFQSGATSHGADSQSGLPAGSYCSRTDVPPAAASNAGAGAGSFGRLVRSDARAKALAGAFQQWCMEQVVDGLRTDDCAGDRTYWCMRRWLERELGEALGAAVAGDKEDPDFQLRMEVLPVLPDGSDIRWYHPKAGMGRLGHLICKTGQGFWSSDAFDALGKMGTAQYWLGSKPKEEDKAQWALNFADVTELNEDFWNGLIKQAKGDAVNDIVEATSELLRESLLDAAESRRAAAGCWRAGLQQDGENRSREDGREIMMDDLSAGEKPIAEICTLGGDLVFPVPDADRDKTVAELKEDVEALTDVPVHEQELVLGRVRLTNSSMRPLADATAAAPIMISLVRRPGHDAGCLCPEDEQHVFLEWAKDYQWDKVREMLQSSPSLVNVQPAGRWSALHQASDSGDTDAVSSLLALRADPELRNKEGQTPKEVAEDYATQQILDDAEAQFTMGLKIQDLGEKRRNVARALQQLEEMRNAERSEPW